MGFAVIAFCSFAEWAFLVEAPYDVEISGVPQLQGRVYSLDTDQYLLVVFRPEVSAQRGFIVNLREKEIGVPNFPVYTRLGRFALVDRMTLLGYPKTHGRLLADVESTDHIHSIRVTALASDPTFADPNTGKYLEEELIYGRRVVLKPRGQGSLPNS